MGIVELILAAILLIAGVAFAFILGKKIGFLRARQEFESKIPVLRQEAVSKSRAVLSGQFSEQLAPYLPDFPFSPTEARFIGKPVDFIVFRGMDSREIESVVFVEVKSGSSTLSKPQRQLKEAVENGRVSWFEYRVPKDLTQAKE